MTGTFCPEWTKSIRGKRLRLGVIGPKPYFFVKDGEIKGSDKLMAGYLAKRLNFEYELVRPKGAFSGMVSAVGAFGINIENIRQMLTKLSR